MQLVQSRDIYTIDNAVGDYIYVKGTCTAGATTPAAQVKVCRSGEVKTYDINSVGLTMLCIDRSSLVVTKMQNYPVIASTEHCFSLASDMLSTSSDSFIVLASYYSIAWTDKLIEALKKCGGSTPENTSTGPYPFAFIGYKGLQQGCSQQVMGTLLSDTPAELSVYVANRMFTTSKDGEKGEPGEPGAPATQYYTWMKFADSLQDNGFPANCYDSPTENTRYVGFAYNQTTPAESTDPTLYAWAPCRGADGADGNSFRVKGQCDEVCSDYEMLLYDVEKTIGGIYLVDGDKGLGVVSKVYVYDYVDGREELVELTADIGDAYVKKSNSCLFVRDEFAWISLGQIQGPQGPQGPRGPEGQRGQVGPLVYPAGQWSANITYTMTDTACPVVEHNGSYWRLLTSSDKGTEPSASNSAVWAVLTSWEAIFTKILFTEFAKLGSAVFSGDYLLSQRGKLNGNVSTAYQNFAPGSSSNPFIPNLYMDFFEGEVWMQKAHVTGEIIATSGKLTDVKIDGTFGAAFSDLIKFSDFEGSIDEWRVANIDRISHHDNCYVYDGDYVHYLSATSRDSGRTISILARTNDVTISCALPDKFLDNGCKVSSIIVKRGQLAVLKGIGNSDTFDYYLVTDRVIGNIGLYAGSIPGLRDYVFLRGRVTITSYDTPVFASISGCSCVVKKNADGDYTVSWTSGLTVGSGDKLSVIVTPISSIAYYATVVSISGSSFRVRFYHYNVLGQTSLAAFMFVVKILDNNI